MIKEAPIRLTVAIDLAKDSEKVSEKTRNGGTHAQVRQELVYRKNRGKSSSVWNRDQERMGEHPENWDKEAQ